MSLLNLGALAQISGAVAIFISLIFVIIELRKNLHQHRLSNMLNRSIEVEKMYYLQMHESLARLLEKGRKSYGSLEGYEKIQLESYLLQKLAIYSRGHAIAAASSYGQKTNDLKNRIVINTKEFLSYEGIRECYRSLRGRDLINDENFVNEFEPNI